MIGLKSKHISKLAHCGKPAAQLLWNYSGRIGVPASAAEKKLNELKIPSLSLSSPLLHPPFLSLNLLADREQRGRSGMKSESKAKEKASALIPALS